MTSLIMQCSKYEQKFSKKKEPELSVRHEETAALMSCRRHPCGTCQEHRAAQVLVLPLQCYLYELLKSGSSETVQSPSAVCPVAIVSFSYTDPKTALVAPPEQRYCITDDTHVLSWSLISTQCDTT